MSSWLAVVAVLVAAPPVARAAHENHGALDLIRPMRPRPAKDFTVAGLAGERLSLRDFKGRVILLEFWATWSLPWAYRRGPGLLTGET